MEETKVVETPAKFKAIVEAIETMSVIDLHELVKHLEEKFGVSAAAATRTTGGDLNAITRGSAQTVVAYGTKPGTATVTANGSTVATALSNQPANTNTTVYTSAGAYTVNVGWSATSSGTTQSGFGMTIADANTGYVIFSTTNPRGLAYTNAGTEVVLPGGGSWFVGATQVRLDPSTASNVVNYYVGSSITFESKYVYTLNVAATYVPPPPAPSGGGGGFDWGGSYWDGGP